MVKGRLTAGRGATSVSASLSVDVGIFRLLLAWTADTHQNADPQDSNRPNCFPRLICDGIGGTGVEQENAQETEENGGPGVKGNAEDLGVFSGG